MSNNESSVASVESGESSTSLANLWLRALAYWLRGKRLLVVAAAMITLGMWLGWGWLVSAGVAPILLSILPCAAMCALGLCMNHGKKPGGDD